MGFPFIPAWIAAICDSEVIRLNSERKQSDKKLAKAVFGKAEEFRANQALKEDIERLEAIISERDGDLEVLTESVRQQQLRIDALEGQNKIQEDEVKSLVRWLDREFAMKEKHLAMHERARYLAMNSLQPPEPDNYDDQLS